MAALMPGRALPRFSFEVSGTAAGCVAALKTLEIYERDGIVASAAHLGEVAAKRMADWPARYPIVG